MSYTTNAAHDLIDSLHIRIARQDVLIAKDTEPIVRAVHVGWRDATERVLRELESALPEIEAEARLVPEHDEDVMSMDERIAQEYWPAA